MLKPIIHFLVLHRVRENCLHWILLGTRRFGGIVVVVVKGKLLWLAGKPHPSFGVNPIK
jgi:hypothetical protein